MNFNAKALSTLLLTFAAFAAVAVASPVAIPEDAAVDRVNNVDDVDVTQIGDGY